MRITKKAIREAMKEFQPYYKVVTDIYITKDGTSALYTVSDGMSVYEYHVHIGEHNFAYRQMLSSVMVHDPDNIEWFALALESRLDGSK